MEGDETIDGKFIINIIVILKYLLSWYNANCILIRLYNTVKSILRYHKFCHPNMV
jgi:hypothetical protein